MNRLRKSRMRTQIRKMRRVLATNDTAQAQAELPRTFSIIDRAAKWGVIKKGTASRYKSRLAARVAKLHAPAA